MEMSILSGLLTILIIFSIYSMIQDSLTRIRTFQMQMKMAEAQAAMTKELPWAELKKLIDEITDFTISNYIIINGLTKMNDVELTLHWTMMLNELCAEIELSLSDEMKRQILKSISKDYMTNYIKNSVQLILVYKLQNIKKNPVNEKVEAIQQEIRNPKK